MELKVKLNIYLEIEKGESVEQAKKRFESIMQEVELKNNGLSSQVYEFEEQ